MFEEKNYMLPKAVLVSSFCVLLLAHCYAAETEKSPAGRTQQKVLAEFKIAKGGDPLLLPVRFKGKECLFMLDTGFTVTGFDTSFRQSLGKVKRRGTVLTAGGPMRGELFDAPEVFLGLFNMQDCGEVTCVDLKMLTLIGGRKVNGIIGMNFLSNYVVQIDFDKGKLLFLQPMSSQNPSWGKELAICYDSLGSPRIVGDMSDGIKVDFIIDTGDNSTGALNREIFKNILAKKQMKTSETLFATAAGTICSRQARIDKFSVGSFEYQDLIFGEGNWSSLGLSFLSRHIVTFDFPNSKVYFKKGKEFNKVDETDMSGLHLLRISNETVVYSVDEGSPAHKAGIRANDIIVSVENKDASEYDMWKLRRLLTSGDKKKIVMTIKRPDELKEVSFWLKKKI